MSKLDKIKFHLSSRVTQENRGLLLYFLANGVPYTCIAQANDKPGATADDDILIVSDNKPGTGVFRSKDVGATIHYITQTRY